MAFIVSKPAEAKICFESDEQASEWNTVVTRQIIDIQGQKNFWAENQTQWGAKPGVNTGNGRLEAMIPPKLWMMMIQRDPDLLHDDNKWNKFINSHKELKVELPKRLF